MTVTWWWWHFRPTITPDIRSGGVQWELDHPRLSCTLPQQHAHHNHTPWTTQVPFSPLFHPHRPGIPEEVLVWLCGPPECCWWAYGAILWSPLYKYGKVGCSLIITLPFCRQRRPVGLIKIWLFMPLSGIKSHNIFCIRNLFFPLHNLNCIFFSTCPKQLYSLHHLFQTAPLIRLCVAHIKLILCQYCLCRFDWVSRGNTAVVTLHSDWSVAGSGIQASWRAVDTSSCPHHTLKRPEGVFTSPNFPQYYLDHLHCSTLISAPSKAKIVFPLYRLCSVISVGEGLSQIHLSQGRLGNCVIAYHHQEGCWRWLCQVIKICFCFQRDREYGCSSKYLRWAVMEDRLPKRAELGRMECGRFQLPLPNNSTIPTTTIATTKRKGRVLMWCRHQGWERRVSQGCHVPSIIPPPPTDLTTPPTSKIPSVRMIM